MQEQVCSNIEKKDKSLKQVLRQPLKHSKLVQKQIFRNYAEQKKSDKYYVPRLKIHYCLFTSYKYGGGGIL